MNALPDRTEYAEIADALTREYGHKAPQAAAPAPSEQPTDELINEMMDDLHCYVTRVNDIGHGIPRHGGHLPALRQIVRAALASPRPAAPPADAPAPSREDRLRAAMERMDRDGPLPGMIAAFEVQFGQAWTDPDWRQETSVWAMAWRAAVGAPEPVQAVLNRANAVLSALAAAQGWAQSRVFAVELPYLP